MKTPTKLDTLCSTLGITSQSSTPFLTTDDAGWVNFAFTSNLVRGGKAIWSGPYHMGTGNLHLDYKSDAELSRKYELSMDESRMWLGMSKMGAKIIPQHKAAWERLQQKLAIRTGMAPKTAGLVYTLITDASCTDGTFEDWCDKSGYDTDSRKAERMFHACRETAAALRKAFSREEMEQLQEACSEY